MFSHIGLSTLDLEKTRDFYEGILKFRAVRCDTITIKEGGQIRHIFFEAGRDQLIAFMEARGVPGIPALCIDPATEPGYRRDEVRGGPRGRGASGPLALAVTVRRTGHSPVVGKV